MANLPNPLKLIEICLVENRRLDIATPPPHLTSALLLLCQSVVDADYGTVLKDQTAQSHLLQYLQLRDPDLGATNSAHKLIDSNHEEASELCRLALAAALLGAFVQVNWTGPALDFSSNDLISHHFPNFQLDQTRINSLALSALTFGGEPAYHLTKDAMFLDMASWMLEGSFQLCLSAQWWLIRARTVHQQILDEPTGSELELLSTNALSLEAMELPGKMDAEGRLALERGLLLHVVGRDRSAAEHFLDAAASTKLRFKLTGALGKRTKFQITDHSQLVVLAESRERHESYQENLVSKIQPERRSGEGTESYHSSSKVLDPKLPPNVALNDDTLLEETHFTSLHAPSTELPRSLAHFDPSQQPALHPIDQCILLAMCLNVKNTSPSHGLTNEQMAPYVARVLLHPRNWSVHTMALLLRSRLEADRSRTVERSTFQLQALIEQMVTADSQAKERLDFFHSLLLPPKWELEKELALRFLSLGIVRSALEIFERLEMWEHVVRCWQTLERPEKGILVIKDLLEGRKREAEQVVRDNKSNVIEVHPVTDPARLAKLWCLLGDLQPDQAMDCYNRAWDISGNRSGRAARSLGGYHFNNGAYDEASVHLERATSINPLLSRSWFLLGCCGVRLERWEQAREAFSRCVAIDDEDSESWNNLATVYLRMSPPTSTGDKPEDSPSGTNVDERLVQAQNKLLAFRALKHGLKHSFENWRMWYNYMLVAADVGELAEACRALTRVIEERAEKDGESCVEFDVLDRLVNAVVQPSEAPIVANANKGKLLAPRVSNLFYNTLLPRFSASPRIFRQFGRFLMWQSAWEPALEAYMNAYRAEAADDGDAITSTQRFHDAALHLKDVLDVLSNLGPRVAQTKGAGEGSKSTVKSNWKFQARSMIRSFLSRTKETYGEETDWTEMEDRLQELRIHP